MKKIHQKIIVKIALLIGGLFIVALLILVLHSPAINESDDPLAPATPQAEIAETIVKDTQEQPRIKTDSNNIPEAVEPMPVQQTRTILFTVPFTAQAPYADWDDQRQQDGCEEASALMAIYWVQDKPLTKYEANKKIEAISDWEAETYGSFHDTSAQDTVTRIIHGYFQHQNATVQNNVELADIIQSLEQGNIVLVPANGQVLGNPYFTQPGPETHMLVIIGYDPTTDEFITNDPGTKRGAGYRYKTSILFNAIRDYPTGDHEPIEGNPKNIIIIGK